MQPTKRIGVWIRVSTEDQVRGESPEHHERRARLYAEAKGWEVVEVYRLDGMSGKSVKDYPETKRMMRDIQTGHITGLIFSKLARLARNTRELLEFAETFRECDADLISLAESIDTSTPAGRLFYTMIAAMAQWEREEISDRVAASIPIRAQMGKPVGGQAPFGYTWKEQKLVPHPDEAPVRQLIYELFREHRRIKTVARILNEKGYRTRKGALFSDTTIGRLIEDTTAKGIRRANYTTSVKRGKAWVQKPEEEWVRHEVPAIVSEELWEECNAVMRKRKGTRPISKRVRHLFSGKAYCADCDSKMYVPSNSPKYTCKECRRKIPVDDLEDIFQEQLRDFFCDEEAVRAQLSAFNDRVGEKETALAVLEKERNKIVSQMDKLFDLYQSGELDKKGFGRRYQPMRERLEQIEAGLPELQAEIDFLKITHLAQDDVVRNAQDLYTHWKNIETEEKRQIVESVVERISIGQEDVEIELYYAPALPGKPQTEEYGSPPPDGGTLATQPPCCGLPR